MAMTWDDLAFIVVFNCGIALVAFIIFNVLRRLPFLSHFYMAKRFLAIPFRCEALVALLTLAISALPGSSQRSSCIGGTQLY